ncbi:hypothetical protein [Microcella frigidaquae]|uniref:Glycosyltransferase n=1 Tax=Microcella frigidaquae TaxID=424758 RepID=A0A840X7N6_9MICO|nr:hypothetical protein [Microcella frigidaquae]MBB5617214.1 hypothetical protein [Microcella frigidaquae]NHN45085.1 hypothetical protein [Microcella frigidaquae]
MVRLSVVVMAHPKRRHAAEQLARDVDAAIVWDERDDEWDTGARAIAAYDPEATHHLVLQDDALPVPDFRRHAAAALDQHPDALVSFYLGTSRPPQWQAAVDRACEQAEDIGAAWLSAPVLLHGVAIAIPTPEIPALLDWCDRPTVPYDERIGMYWRYVLDRPVLYTWPSLVDHEDGAPVAAHRDGEPRDEPRRARLLGWPQTWNTPVVPIGG